MIKDKTVLVLGAGASYPYHFPTGRGLMKLIYERLTHQLRDYRSILQEYEFDDAFIRQFCVDLHHSNLSSIDSFLEKNPHYRRIGVVAISLALIPCETPENVVRDFDKPQWYEYLFNQMVEGDFNKSRDRLTIITFNYDRSLEYFLFDSLRHAFHLNEDDAAKIVQGLGIVHMYGQLGKPEFTNKGTGRAFDPTVTKEAIDKCIPEIKIVSDSGRGTNEMATAWAFVGVAKVLCFIGFGYDRTNLLRLRIQSFQGNEIFGSTYRMEKAEIDRAILSLDVRNTAPVRLGDGNEDALLFLRRYPVFE